MVGPSLSQCPFQAPLTFFNSAQVVHELESRQYTLIPPAIFSLKNLNAVLAFGQCLSIGQVLDLIFNSITHLS